MHIWFLHRFEVVNMKYSKAPLNQSNLHFGKQHGHVMLAKGWNEKGGSEENFAMRDHTYIT